MAPVLETPIQHAFLGLAIAFVILTAFITGVRFWARQLKAVQFELDDWLAFAALIFYWGEVGVHLWSMFSGGVGLHKEHVSPQQLATAFKSLTVVEYPYTASLTCIRISIAWLMRRIFVQKWFSYSIYGVIVLNIAWLLYIFFDAAFICRPFAFNWDPTIPGGKCGNKTQSFIIMAVWGIIIDAITWSLPLFVIWTIQTTRKRKIELSVLFGLGAFDIAVSIVRIVQLTNLDIDGDFSYTLAPVEIWSFIEAGVAIIIANLPLCRPVVQYIFGYSKPQLSDQRRSYRIYRERSRTLVETDFRDDDLQLYPAVLGSTSFTATGGKSALTMTTSMSDPNSDEGEPAKDSNNVTIRKEVIVSTDKAV